MGWAYGIDKNGREIGYGVKAKCDQHDCDTDIDRGLAYRCGGDDFDAGCSRYFCYSHLFFNSRGQRCRRCIRMTKDEPQTITKLRKVLA